MTSYIVYRTQRLTSLRLKFSPGVEFREVVDDFNDISYPPTAVNPELLSFAILELVSNSIRAHREKGIADEVQVTLVVDSGELHATVLDAGRGFDPTKLPYDLEAKPESVDIMSQSFAEYREQFDGSRFGMGLYVAKKTFPEFTLIFVDGQGKACPWFSGTVRGTKIDLGLPIMEKEAIASLEDSGGLEAVEEEA
jgi:anti-sigma regulatory factor (Ser/Thr protein kinase)